MSIRWSCWLALAIVVSAVRPSAAQSDSGPALDAFVPDIFSERDMESAKRLLALSAPQNEILNRLYAIYIEQWKAELDAATSDLRRAALDGSELFTTPDGRFGQEAVDAFEKMESLRSALLKKLRSIDNAMWDQLAPLLAEHQTARLLRVRQHRDRDRCQLLSREIPCSRTDLVLLLRQQGIETFESLPESDLALIVAEYDDAITPAWIALDEALAKTETRALQAAVDLLFPGDGAQRSRYRDQLREIMHPVVRLQRRIVTINNVFLPRILELLPEDQRKQLKSTYQRLGYPAIYPDPLDPTSIFDEMTSAEITDEQRNILRAVWMGYRDGYEAVCKQLERRETEWWEEFVFTRSSQGMTEFRETMQRLRNDRWTRSKIVVEQMHALLPPEVALELKPLVDDYLNQVTRLIEKDAGDRYPR